MRLGVKARQCGRPFLFVACAALAAFVALAPLSGAGAQAGRGAKARRAPNVILIVADDLGRGDLGAYGQRFIRTPNLDRMAREGLRFTDAYAPAPVCAPSRASFMTGLHQGHARIRGNMGRNNERVSLRPEDVTVAEVLKGAGYRTGVIGKWGLGEPGTAGVPGRQGFDYFFGYLNQNHAHNYYPDYLWRDDERVNIPKGTYSHDLFTREALDFIRREAAAPFFLYLAYTLPHANNELTRKTGNGMEAPSDAPYTGEPWTPQQRNYAAMVTRLDADVGKVFELLKELKLDDDTLVVFTSDNGPQDKSEGGYDQTLFDSNGPFRGLKRELYEGGIRAPLIVRWPGRVQAGRTSDYVTTLCDLMPTFAALAGARAPERTDGVSLLPLLLGGRAPRREYLYWEFHEGGFVQAVRVGRWKVVARNADGLTEVYDLSTDPGEQHNVAARHHDIIMRASEIMRREHVASEDWPVESGIWRDGAGAKR
ncbi:MAG TPA: arylsulfatase [Pyrinomonadaceae bacterium]|nr:arylsulfatase [Pyrinomonadaceae bacterium]